MRYGEPFEVLASRGTQSAAVAESGQQGWNPEEYSSKMDRPAVSRRWLNRTVIGIGLASLFSDWSHEIATTLLPAFLATMGVAAAWLGLIEGVSDGLSSFAKLYKYNNYPTPGLRVVTQAAAFSVGVTSSEVKAGSSSTPSASRRACAGVRPLSL
jgi:hypothetical protein